MRNKGFTLIELMIVFAIIGILAAIFIPAYYDYVEKDELQPTVPAQVTTNEPSRVQVGTPDSQSEMCIEGIKYLLVVKDGVSFMTAKVDRYAGKETC